VTAQFDQTYVMTREKAEPIGTGRARLLPGQATRPDWHNDRAAFLASLNTILQQLPDDAGRQKLIRSLEAAISTAAPPGSA
jgi:metallo-beta-lactamase family protein